MVDYTLGSDVKTGGFDQRWIGVVSRCMALASPKDREKILQRINERVAEHDNEFVVDGYVDRSLAVDCQVEGRWGDHYLYVWLDAKGVPFYAGQSNSIFTRPSECKSNRTPQFKAKIAEGGCHCVLVAKHIHSWDINYLEQDLIAYLACRGYELVNTKDMPSKEKLVLWNMVKGYANEEEVRKAFRKNASVDEIVSVFREWRQCISGINPIIDVLEKVIGVAWAGETATLKAKERPKAKTVVYNGVEKTYAEWAQEPGVTVGAATIQQRIEKRGWSVEDALFTPSISKIQGTPEERRAIFASYSQAN